MEINHGRGGLDELNVVPHWISLCLSVSSEYILIYGHHVNLLTNVLEGAFPR